MSRTIILTVENKHSSTDECVCCDGKHLFATNLRTDEGDLYYVGEFVREVARKLPNGAKVKITVEAVSTKKEDWRGN